MVKTTILSESKIAPTASLKVDEKKEKRESHAHGYSV